ncbi:MAG: PKD domain-containing protein, partial [Bacteroidetes bacterium]|nr:PKD domain-containing protein [Bacteroidota bacterium]
MTPTRLSPLSLLSLLLWLAIILTAGPPANAQPHAAFTVDVDSGAAPLSLQFTDQSTPADSIIGWAWDVNGDGITDSQDRNPRWTYELPGRYTVRLVVRDSASSDTAVYVDFIDVAPVLEEDIACLVRVVEYSSPLVRYVELWGYEGSGLPAPLSPVSMRMPVDSSGQASFYWGKFLNVLSQNITDLLLLDENFRVLGKTGFSYPYKDLAARRRRDAVVFLHRDLTSYQQHPREQADATRWIFPARNRFPWLPGRPAAALATGGEAQNGPLYQTTLLLPPAAYDSGAVGYAQFLLANRRPDRFPLLLLADMEQTRAAWGVDTDIITPADTLVPGFNGKHDYAFTSSTARLQQRDHSHDNHFDVWEYYYPPDQNWEESAYLFARDLDWLLDGYDTTQAAVAAHGVGGLVLRAYLEGTARNYTYFGPEASAIPYRGDVFKAVFLGTPHAGRLRAGMAYVAPDALTPTDVMDQHAPVLRELMPGRESLQRLNPQLLPYGVTVLNIAGSAPLVSPPLPVESARHDDGRTALSSALLPAPRTTNAILGGWSSAMLQSPDDPEGRQDAPDPALIPELIHAFVRSDSTLEAYRSRFLFFQGPDSLHFASSVYTPPSALPLHADVGFSTLRLTADGVPFPMANTTRLRLDLTSGARLHFEDIDGLPALTAPGLHFYPTALCFSDQPAICQLAWQDPVFFTLSTTGSTNPLRGEAIALDGLGWQLPVQQQSIVPDPFLSRTDDLGRVFDVARAAGDLLLAWSREKRNTLAITAHEATVLNPLRRLHGGEPDPSGFVEFTVDCLTNELTVLLDYGSNSEPLFALMEPGGVPVDASSANDSTVFFTHHPQLHVKFLTIRNPAQGDWRLLVDNAPALPPGCRVASITNAAKDLQLTLLPSLPLSGQELTVTLALDATGPVATERSASCVIIDSSGTRRVIQVRDDGNGPDTTADDGVFTGSVMLGRAGTYRIEGFYFATAGGCRIRRSVVRPLVLPPALELLTPTGGEEWRTGTRELVRWQGIAPQQVVLDFSADNGVSWTQIAGPLPVTDGAYEWTVPGFTSTSCRMRVRDANGSLADASPDPFTVYLRPEIDLLAPDGGESWQVDTRHDVLWSSIAVDRVDLSISTDGGVRWQPIESGVLARLGGYSWQLPLTPSDSALLRIVSSDNATVSDRSAALFRITAVPAVTVQSPNGGERWRIGSTHTVRWQSAEVDSVLLESSFDAGASWEVLTIADAEAGAWEWTLPDRVSDRCMLRATDTRRPTVTDESDAVFAVTPHPFLQLLAPVGGESWEIGTTQNIRWSSAEVSSIDIEYTTDSGVRWITAAVNIPSAPGMYAWNVPTEPSDYCRVRITDTHDSTRVSVSPLPFRISESETRPTLFAPQNGRDGVSTRPIFGWQPFRDAISYQLQVTNDVTLGSWVINVTGLTAVNFPSPELARNTRYFWRVKAFRSGWESEWSTMWEFTTSGSILTSPRQAQPFDNSIGLATTLNLRWNAAPEADAYHLQVALDDRFTTLVHEQTGLTGLTTFVGGLEHDQDYWWRLRSGHSSSTVQSDWSRPWKFSTAPAPPRQLTPFDGLPDVPLNALLNWYPVPGARAYRLQVADDESFNAIVFDSSFITGTSIQVTGLRSFRTFYWRLNATTSRGTSDWNRPWMFRTVDIGTGIGNSGTSLPDHPLITAVWPQPARTRLSVACALPGVGEYRIGLYDFLGREVRAMPVQDRSAYGLEMDVTGLPSGPYLLRLSG